MEATAAALRTIHAKADRDKVDAALTVSTHASAAVTAVRCWCMVCSAVAWLGRLCQACMLVCRLSGQGSNGRVPDCGDPQFPFLQLLLRRYGPRTGHADGSTPAQQASAVSYGADIVGRGLVKTVPAATPALELTCLCMGSGSVAPLGGPR